MNAKFTAPNGVADKLVRDLFVACNGDLVDLNSRQTVREKFQYQHRRIEDTLQLRATLRAGEFTWPGGYRMAFCTRDGGILSFDAVRDNYRLVSDSIRTKCNDGWWVDACDMLEGCEYPVYCDHTGEQLNGYEEEESA